MIKDHKVSIDPSDSKDIKTLNPIVISIETRTPVPAAAIIAAKFGSI